MRDSIHVETKWVLPLDSELADLASAGGKGASLARMRRAGFPVPEGFLVHTLAYREFLRINQLGEVIHGLLEGLDAQSPDALEAASAQIRARFRAGQLPPGLAEEVRDALARMPGAAVAVRSSATAEDLPEMSFAGQQDTFLNVVGAEAVLRAVADCWGSLWTARAIGYRMRNQVPQLETALCVVVQRMVESQASGVLFTANPLTGLRSQTVIEAALGLGEALVSGQVEPDQYVVEPRTGRILSKTLGRKEVSIHGQTGGGTHTQHEDRSQEQALPDAAILELAAWGQRTAELYGFPQDVEWAWAEEKLYLLQSRPITSLFPLPEGMSEEPLRVMFSFAAVQGMYDPITPTGRSFMVLLVQALSTLYGIRVTETSQNVLFSAGERLWANITALASNSVGRKVLPIIFDYVEPTVKQALAQIWEDPRLQPKRAGVSLRARLQIARAAIPVAANVFLNMAAPVQRRAALIQFGERMLKDLQDRFTRVTGDRWQKLNLRVEVVYGFVLSKIPRMFRRFVSGVASGMAAWRLLDMLSSRAVDQPDLILEVTRGMPNNPTTEMDLRLWKIAQRLRSDSEARQAFAQFSPQELAERYQHRELPPSLQNDAAEFLAAYGARGYGEIDLGHTRWAEDPTHVFEMLSSFMQIEDESLGPDVVFARGAERAQQAIEQVAQRVRQRHGWLRERLVRFLAGRARQWLGMREAPKFLIVRYLWMIRQELLQSGQELAAAGDLERAEDIFFLTLSEMRQWAQQNDPAWRDRAAQRRETFERERKRRQIPRLLLSDGRAFFDGMFAAEQTENVISGSPVSPGIVEGNVRVVLDPRQAGLQPGEILVCPGTDPSWTPLFLSAGGLVMEMGGMMTHGAVVAREYGIPAVVGVDRATHRLHDGQRIRVNGSNGRIELLDL